MSRRTSFSKKYKLSRVPLESVVKAALSLKGIDPESELGRRKISEVWNAYFVQMPSSKRFVRIVRRDDGVEYKVEGNHTIDDNDRKFVQRLFSLAWRLASSSRSAQMESSNEERKKDTSDVSEFTSGTSESVHGGDSSSGEVPDGVSGGGEEDSKDMSSMQDQDACSASSGSSSESSADASTAPAQSRQDGSDSDSQKSLVANDGSYRDSDGAGSSGSGAALEAPECAAPTQMDGDAPQAWAEACGEGTDGVPVVEIIDGRTREQSTVPSISGAEEAAPGLEREEASVSFKDLRKKMRELSSSSTCPKSSFGGVYGMLAEIGAPPKELVNRGRRVFSRLISDLAEGEAGPRWDYRKVSVRIASLQNFKVRDRKNETGRPAIAVLPDVSGSMAAFAHQVLEFAKVLGELGVPGAEVVVVPQSNGRPVELWVNGKKLNESMPSIWDKDEVADWYLNIFKRYSVQVVVLAADWDGEVIYHWMAETLQVKIFWCDVWSSSRFAPMVVDFPPRWACPVREWSRSATKKVRYAFGCRDVIDFITALEKMVKQGR